jgi:hypothetical protein
MNESKMPAKVENIFRFCQKYGGVFTGSRAMGLENKNSDWDFALVLEEEQFYRFPQKICNRFGGYLKKEDDYSPLVGVRHVIEIWCERKWLGLFNAPPKVNVIIDNGDLTSIQCWIDATEYCKANPEKAKNKLDRIDIFESFGVIQEDGYICKKASSTLAR